MSNLGPGAGSLIDNVRSELQEIGTTNGQWSDTEFKNWLQQANDEVTRDARIEVLAPQIITTINGTEHYALNADALDTRRVELQQDTSLAPALATAWIELQRATLDERMPNITSVVTSGKGMPLKYFVWSDNLFVVPVPDTAYNLQVWYYAKGNTLAAPSDTPLIPAEFHFILELYAVARGKRKYDDPAFQTYLNDYETERALMKRKLRDRRTAGRFDRIVQTGA